MPRSNESSVLVLPFLHLRVVDLLVEILALAEEHAHDDEIADQQAGGNRDDPDELGVHCHSPSESRLRRPPQAGTAWTASWRISAAPLPSAESLPAATSRCSGTMPQLVQGKR